MRQLMISLDKKILDPNSAVARRMIKYGEKEELFILIPHTVKRQFDLSSRVHVEATGGSKLQQLWRLYTRGAHRIKQYNNITIWQSITTQDPFFTGLAGLLIKHKTGVPLEVQLHGDFYSSDYYQQSGCKNWLQYHLGKYVLARADRLRVVGQRIRESLTRFGVARDKIMVRPIAVDTERIQPHHPTLDLHKKYSTFKKIFLLLGRLDPVKNIGWLIDLWAKVTSDYLLLIVGEGSERVILQSQANGQENIRFEPWTEDPISYLKTADGLLFPSLSEGYGLVPMEAAAAGTPVIMNDVGVANYELKPSEKVKIISISDREAWIQAILTI